MTETAAVTSPFGAEQVDEIVLASSPLIRVLAQVRFPRLSSMASDGGVALANRFATEMSDGYPLLSEQRESVVTVTAEGLVPSPTGPRVWQLRSADESWQVSFSETFLTVDTAAYVTRETFAARLEAAWSNFVEIVAPPFVERVGVRYINRLTDGAHLQRLPELVRPEVLGGLAVDLEGVALNHSMSEALYQIDQAEALQARWGLLPGGAVLDATITPVDTPGWVLDLDSFTVAKRDPQPEAITAVVSHLAERAYRYFRWVVTPEFLATFGGEVA